MTSKRSTDNNNNNHSNSINSNSNNNNLLNIDNMSIVNISHNMNNLSMSAPSLTTTSSNLNSSTSSTTSSTNSNNNSNNNNHQRSERPSHSFMLTRSCGPSRGHRTLDEQIASHQLFATNYLNRQIVHTSGLGRLDFNMKSEDLDQPWFHKEATRDVAIALLRNKPEGTFLIRPSSQPGSYAMSWMKVNNEIGHNLIYGLCPGYSLKQDPHTKDRFWSLQTLVEDCTYLRHAILVSNYTRTVAKNSNAKTNAEVVGRIIEKLYANDPAYNELFWGIAIVGDDTNESACQKRTSVKFGPETYTAPEILPLNNNSLFLVCQAIRDTQHVKTFVLNGYDGYLRLSYISNLTDADCECMADMIKNNKSLTYLNLSINQVTDIGAKLIAEALKVNTTLKYVSLSCNFIARDGLIAMTEVIRFNKNLDYLDVSQQLKKKRTVDLNYGDVERTLISLIEDTMKRKCELFGQFNYNDIPKTISSFSDYSSHSNYLKLPSFHGYLTKQGAEKRINALSKSPGAYLFYLNYFIPNSIFLALSVQNRFGQLEIEHRMIHRVHFGYRFVGSGLNNEVETLRDEMIEEERLYNFQLNNQTYNNSITHSNSYIYNYRHRPRRTGCGVVIPTLFEFCSWILASHPQYDEIYNALEKMGGISERFKDIRDLTPLWGARDVLPIISQSDSTIKHNISRKGVYPTLTQLIKINNKRLTTPITTENYSRHRETLRQLHAYQQQKLQQQQQFLKEQQQLKQQQQQENNDNNNNI